MFKRLRHIILSGLLLFIFGRTTAQISMPDNVCAGTTRTYSVNDPTVPSTYTWKIDGVVQTSTINSITITWTTPGTYTLSVVEHNAAGCGGVEQTGAVTVNPPTTRIFNAIGPLCQSSNPPPLPTTSPNGITGTWNPAT